ncbi:hypothetical protein [Niallia circulans]|nr:hypothetical protein [Niallia circulans]
MNTETEEGREQNGVHERNEREIGEGREQSGVHERGERRNWREKRVKRCS